MYIGISLGITEVILNIYVVHEIIPSVETKLSNLTRLKLAKSKRDKTHFTILIKMCFYFKTTSPVYQVKRNPFNNFYQNFIFVSLGGYIDKMSSCSIAEFMLIFQSMYSK